MTSSRDGAWASLEAQAARVRALPAAQLFGGDPARFVEFVARSGPLRFDYSRQKVDRAVLRDLCALADACGLRAEIAGMFGGKVVNATESRPALHVAVRQPRGAGLGGAAVEAEVLAERDRMLDFAERVRRGAVKGSASRPFRDVVNIGIGGSDLGPAMAVEALRAFSRNAPRVRFASNVDGCGLHDILEECDPAETLFIVASKTFTTQETMANARTARRWLAARLGETAVPGHFAAVSVNAAAMDAFGVHPDYRFRMWDWVGGRYSLWSSIGVSLAVAIGRDGFLGLLAGAHDMDLEFRDAPWERNVPVLMALLGVWNSNLLGLPTLAVLPYDSRLARLPAYLQQLEMESNGKSVTRDGRPVVRETAPVVWGEPGNNAQHSFFQLLHQGSPRAALDMLLPLASSCGSPEHQELAIANCLAQADVFMNGQAGSDVPSQKVHVGGRPVSLFTFDRLEPRTLGALLAAYEHKVFAQSVFWDINAFDQWGVELGKKVAERVLGWMRSPGSGVPDSMAPVLEAIRRGREP